MQPLSYGCMQEIAKHEVRVTQGDLGTEVLNAVKSNLKELTTKSIHSAFSYNQPFFLHMRMCWNSSCSLFEAFLRLLWVWTFSVVWSGSSSSGQFSSPLPSLFTLLYQCVGCLLPFPVWGPLAGLPGFASHGSSLHLGASCQ